MYGLYNSLYKKCLNNDYYAYSVHRDIIKTIGSIYLPKILFYKDGPPKPLSREEINNLFNKSNIFSKRKPKSFWIRNIIIITNLFVISSLLASKLLFYFYNKYERFLLYLVFQYCTIPMTFKFQSSIIWRGFGVLITLKNLLMKIKK